MEISFKSINLKTKVTVKCKSLLTICFLVYIEVTSDIFGGRRIVYIVQFENKPFIIYLCTMTCVIDISNEST